MKLVFMGTPGFSVYALEALRSAGHEICLVVTQPDRPAGRGKQTRASAVKACALQHDLPIAQPNTVRDAAFLEQLRSYQADCFVVVAYGQFLPLSLLELPRYGCVNVHASLLPKYRGASPINWVLVSGEQETGITTMLMDKGMDTGNILLQDQLLIGSDETAPQLHDRLAVMGGALLLKTLSGLEQQTIIPQQQDEQCASYAPLLQKSQGLIDWHKPAVIILHLIRGLSPWPGCYSFLQGKRLVITEASLWTGEQEIDPAQQPGTLFWENHTKSLLILTGAGCLSIKKIKPENRKELTVDQFIAGYKGKVDQLFLTNKKEQLKTHE